MRNAVFHGAGKPLVIETRPVPVPGFLQALIRVERCGICSSDLHVTSGGPLDVAPGTALGHEYSGEVVDLGTAVRNLRAGDRVTAVPMKSCGACPACLADRPLHCPSFQSMQGGYGEFVLVDARMAVRLPNGMDHDAGALVEPHRRCDG